MMHNHRAVAIVGGIIPTPQDMCMHDIGWYKFYPNTIVWSGYTAVDLNACLMKQGKRREAGEYTPPRVCTRYVLFLQVQAIIHFFKIILLLEYMIEEIDTLSMYRPLSAYLSSFSLAYKCSSAKP